MSQGRATTYRGNIWRLFTAQALLMFILWVPIWVVDPPSAIGVSAALFAIAFIPLRFVWRSADARP